MQCPRCSNKLVDGTYEERDASHCNACSGTLFEQSALGAALQRMSIDLFSTVSTEMSVPPLPDVKEGADCPRCQKPMENYGYMGSHKVMLDACNQCQLVWVDALELATMAQMRARLDKNVQKSRKSYRPLDIVGSHIATTSRVNTYMVMRMMGIGMVESAFATHFIEKLKESGL